LSARDPLTFVGSAIILTVVADWLALFPLCVQPVSIRQPRDGTLPSELPHYPSRSKSAIAKFVLDHAKKDVVKGRQHIVKSFI
jgi:hypothetical protein